MYAFWKHNSFPNILGGEIEKLNQDGTVHVKGHAGVKFTPIAIRPDEAGADIKQKLQSLREEFLKAEDNLAKEYAEKINYIMTYKYKD